MQCAVAPNGRSCVRDQCTTQQGTVLSWLAARRSSSWVQGDPDDSPTTRVPVTGAGGGGGDGGGGAGGPAADSVLSRECIIGRSLLAWRLIQLHEAESVDGLIHEVLRPSLFAQSPADQTHWCVCRFAVTAPSQDRLTAGGSCGVDHESTRAQVTLALARFGSEALAAV